MTPEGPERTILSYPSPSLPLALRTADRSIIRGTPFRGIKMVRYIEGWSFSTWCIARKTFRYKKGPFSHERRESILSSLLSLSREGKRKRVLWGEGELLGAFLKILHCIQNHKWNAKQGWEGSELRNKSEASPLLTSLYKATLFLSLYLC